MNATEWIAKRRELAAEATVGPWEWLAYGGGMQLVRHNAPYHDHNILKTTDDWPPYTQDAAFIADARTSLPRALGALEAVLEVVRLHRREPATDGSVDEYDYVGELADEFERAIETALRGES